MLMEASFIHRRSLLQVVAVVPVAVALAFIAFQRDRFVLSFRILFLEILSSSSLIEEDSLSDICKASLRNTNFPPTSLIDT